MAVTVNYAILPQHWKEDGTNLIRIRITHKRKSRYLITNIALERADLTRSGNLKHQGKEDLANDEVKRIRAIVDAMTTAATDEMDVDDVVRYVKAKRAEGEGYNPQVKLVPLTATANTEHKFPVEWITEDGTGIKEEFFAYALPLIQGEPELPKQDSLPRLCKLKKILAK